MYFIWMCNCSGLQANQGLFGFPHMCSLHQSLCRRHAELRRIIPGRVVIGSLLLIALQRRESNEAAVVDSVMGWGVKWTGGYFTGLSQQEKKEKAENVICFQLLNLSPPVRPWDGFPITRQINLAQLMHSHIPFLWCCREDSAGVWRLRDNRLRFSVRIRSDLSGAEEEII